MFKDKKVLLGITASIAAYKSAELVRLFKKAGAIIQVIQTKESTQFISPLTLSTLSDNPVLSTMIDSDNGEWNNHVSLGSWADFIVIAPLTANTLAKMVNGDCDNLLLAVYLSAKCQVYFAPAMDLDMYKHPSTKYNIKKLEEYGNILIPSAFGELASGLVGEGRMAEPKDIMEAISINLNKNLSLTNKRVLITAGPTYESIDPVRFIGNRSSGKMGISLAMECANNGAKVDLVLGPTYLNCIHSNIDVHSVESANDMFKKVDDLFNNSDIAIFSAAVSDYTPKNISNHKIKKEDKESIVLDLKKTEDILLSMSSRKNPDQFIVGFALETENELINATEKLESKKLDMVILNSLNNKGAGFQYDTNKITIIEKNKKITEFSLKQKRDVAKDIVNSIVKIYNA